MVDLETAIELRDEAKRRFLRDYLKLGDEKTNFTSFGMADAPSYLPPDRRLALGVAFGDEGRGNGLAVRLAKRQGLAYRAANEIAEDLTKQGAFVDMRVVDRLSVPSRSSIAGADVGGVGDELSIGLSVAHARAPAGTLGGFVRIKDVGDGIIGACHILANGGRSAILQDDNNEGSPIYHPASQDVIGPMTAKKHKIGNLRNYVPLDSSSVEVDAAVASVDRGHAGNVLPQLVGAELAGQRLRAPPSMEDISSFRDVGKVGRTSGYKTGRLTAGFFDEIGLDVPGHGLVYYSRMFEVQSGSQPFAEPGDSGAVVFDLGSLSAFAMVVGGGVWEDGGKEKALVYCCNLSSALNALDAQWL